ncbi:MAG: helix-turn-helix transcriptional regulator [Gemmataceae bacterium]|nr:helix-turn-helix transcriptional regulator [Gemmataceae bacterium]
MPRTKYTPGQKLWLSFYRADLYKQEAEKIGVPRFASRLNPKRATKRWLQGMSRHLQKNFPVGLRQRREELSLTQRELADIAGLTSTAVAMIERGERLPNLDTAARLCWALDIAAGVALEQPT